MSSQEGVTMWIIEAHIGGIGAAGPGEQVPAMQVNPNKIFGFLKGLGREMMTAGINLCKRRSSGVTC